MQCNDSFCYFNEPIESNFMLVQTSPVLWLLNYLFAARKTLYFAGIIVLYNSYFRGVFCFHLSWIEWFTILFRKWVNYKQSKWVKSVPFVGWLVGCLFHFISIFIWFCLVWFCFVLHVYIKYKFILVLKIYLFFKYITYRATRIVYSSRSNQRAHRKDGLSSTRACALESPIKCVRNDKTTLITLQLCWFFLCIMYI